MHYFSLKPQEVLQPFIAEIQRRSGFNACEIQIETTAHQHFKVYAIYPDTRYRRDIGEFYLTQLPGCCGVCVSHTAFIQPDHRKKGLGTILNALRVALAKASGYGMIICTTAEGNIPQEKILMKNGWSTVAQFMNPKTTHKVKQWQLAL